MKAYAEKFYKGKAWQTIREAYLISQQYICERCDMPASVVHHKTYITPENISNYYITLCFDNLEALCVDCHNKEHHRNEDKQVIERYRFDDYGNITVPP